MNKVLLNGLLFGALAGLSQTSAAALTGTDSVLINFPASIMNQSSYGSGVNQIPAVGGSCPEVGGVCYYEDGFVIGSPTDSNTINHIHRVAGLTGGGLADKALAYHSDSSGIYLRAQDGSAFDFSSVIFKAPISESNYIYGAEGIAANPFGLSSQSSDIGLLGPQERWEIFGFSSAVNANITSNDAYGTAIAYGSVANGFYGTIGTDAASGFVLDEAFKNVAAIWIHYNGYPTTPNDGIAFDATLDNIVLGAPVVVPVPAAVWLFGSGLLGLISFGRRKFA